MTHLSSAEVSRGTRVPVTQSRPLRIAIADDHAVVRSGYRRLLELDQAVEVVAEFADGESAYRWLSGHAADILILDLSMPGRGGLATLQRLRHRVPGLRVLVFTMHDSPSLAAQALRLGASGYITKSSPPESLIDAIRTIDAGGCPLSSEVASALQTMRKPICCRTGACRRASSTCSCCSPKAPAWNRSLPVAASA